MIDRPKNFHPRIPVGVKLKAALIQLGLGDEKIEWDHDPALESRPWDPIVGDTIPPANDPNFIKPMTEFDHDKKTNGPGGTKRITTKGSDTHNRKRARDLQESHAEHLRRMQGKCGDARIMSGSIKSRPFPRKK